MAKTVQVSASILCADFTRLGEEIKKCEAAGVDSIHVDVMDGHFVPNLTIGALIVKAIRPLTKLPIEAHLMVEHPGTLLDDFISAGSDVVSIHVECYGVLRERCRGFGKYPKEVDRIDEDLLKADMDKIKARGSRVFLVVNPGTPLCLGPVLQETDGVLLMSVNPGFANQKFIPAVLPKIQTLRTQFSGPIAVDGGINAATAVDAVKAGADVLITASYFFSANNPREIVDDLKSLGR